MRLLFIEPCFRDFGGYFRSYQICQSLANQGIKVDLLISSKKSILVRHFAINSNFSVYELPRLPLSFYFNGRLVRALIALVFGLIRPYDIIHATAPTQPESNLPSLILRLLGKNVVIGWDDIWEESQFQNKVIQSYISFWERFSPSFFKNLVTISDYITDLAQKRGATRIIKIINGTSPNTASLSRSKSRARLNLNSRLKYLFTFGHTFSGDRAILLLTTFKNIHKLNPNVRLITNFDPFLSLSPAHQKHFLSLKDVIINAGYIPKPLLDLYLNAADAVIFLFGRNINEKACFPVRFSRIIASGSAIIINDNDSELCRLLGRYQCAIIDPNLKTLAQKAVDVLDQPAKLSHLRNQTHRLSRDITWDKLVVPLIKYYRLIINQPPSN